MPQSVNTCSDVQGTYRCLAFYLSYIETSSPRSDGIDKVSLETYMDVTHLNKAKSDLLLQPRPCVRKKEENTI